MTNLFYGSSLFQARKTEHVHKHTHSYSHSHLHNRKSGITHARSHADFHNRRQETADLDPRDSAVTEVVQTISVVQIIDGAGATLSAQTVPGNSQTDLIDGETGSTIAVNYKAAVTTSSDPDATTTSASAVSAVSSVDPVSGTGSAITSTDTATSNPAALSLTHISSSLPASSFSTLSSTSNSTTSSLTSSFASSSSIPSLLSTPSPSNSSSTSSTDSASFTPSQSVLSGSSSSSGSPTTFASSILSSTSNSFSSSPTWSGDSSSTGWLSPSDSASAASSIGGVGGSDATSTAAGTTSTSASADSGSSSSSTTTQTSKVAGGIVGGIAGLALLVGLAFMILRMKKRGWCHLKLGGGEDEPDAAARQALPAPSAGGDGNGAEGSSAYGTMQQRSAPQAVAASLAALAGKRSSRERAGTGSEMAERGFVRVSGKKLPPVLQYGGDGYSDPRDNRASHMSDASASVYRDSIAVFDQPNHQRLALGSPMRPESGIMTMHPGPARTPVTGQVPKAIDSPTLPRSNTFPSTDALGRTLESEGFSRDAIGRTLAAHDQSRDGAASRGSHNSRGSTRFTEHVT